MTPNQFSENFWKILCFYTGIRQMDWGWDQFKMVWDVVVVKLSTWLPSTPISKFESCWSLPFFWKVVAKKYEINREAGVGPLFKLKMPFKIRFNKWNREPQIPSKRTPLLPSWDSNPIEKVTSADSCWSRDMEAFVIQATDKKLVPCIKEASFKKNFHHYECRKEINKMIQLVKIIKIMY